MQFSASTSKTTKHSGTPVLRPPLTVLQLNFKGWLLTMDEVSNASNATCKVNRTANSVTTIATPTCQEKTLPGCHNPSTGSMAGEKIKLLDITRGKPIKLTVRVIVPTKDHPNFNFVGKLLGPKGNSMKRLQEETMCKMAVLGRGSIRDWKKEEELRASGDPRYAHLSHDLHVEISTYATPTEAHARIAYALAEVRSFLIPDNNDAIRQQQMLEIKAMKSQNGTSLTDKFERNSLKNLLGVHNTYTFPITSEVPVRLEGLLSPLPPPPHHPQPATAAAIVAAPVATTPNPIVGQLSKNVAKNDGSGTGPPISTTTTSSTVGTNSIATFTPHHPHHPSAFAIHYQLESSESCIRSDSRVASLAEIPATESIFAVKGDTGLRAPTVAYIHPTVQVVKAVNDASLVRKRPYVAVPYGNMHPTKRAVMTLLARAKTSRAMMYRSKLQKAEQVKTESK